MRRKHSLVLILLVLCVTIQVQAQVPIFTPSDTILGGQLGLTDFNVGAVGGGGNAWPPGELPEFAIDGFGQKYLNFGELNTGFIVTPSIGSSVAESMQLWTANDAEERDPSSYELWGTNVSIAGGGPFPISDFTQISSGALSLPSTRNAGGMAPLLNQNSETVLFTNEDAYTSYLVIFPDVKNSSVANSMQIADVQLFGTPDLNTTVSLEVNQVTGLTRLNNGSAAAALDINGYQIRSDAGSLDPSGWVSLADNPMFPAATSPGAGDGWEEGGGVNESLLTEAYLLGFSTIDPGQSISLGQAYDTTVAAEDIEFLYSRPDGFLGQAPIVFVDSLTCDFDGSGSCDGVDIDMLVDNIANGPADPMTFDLTGDNLVNLADRDEWLVQAGAENLANGNPYLLGDATLDGVVDGLDFIAWNNNKFTMGAIWTGGDFNADGIIDGLDFIVWNQFKFQASDAVAAVPEPGFALLWWALAVAGCAWRKTNGH